MGEVTFKCIFQACLSTLPTSVLVTHVRCFKEVKGCPQNPTLPPGAYLLIEEMIVHLDLAVSFEVVWH